MTSQPAVLVVDDSDDHRFITATELKRLKLSRKVRVDEAGSGEDALVRLGALLGEGFHVLVLSDYRMPRMGGIELLQLIRNRWPHAPVRVVIYSSTDQGVGQESIQSGADQFMVKPMDLGDFRNELRRLVESFLGGEKTTNPAHPRS